MAGISHAGTVTRVGGAGALSSYVLTIMPLLMIGRVISAATPLSLLGGVLSQQLEERIHGLVIFPLPLRRLVPLLVSERRSLSELGLNLPEQLDDLLLSGPRSRSGVELRGVRQGNVRAVLRRQDIGIFEAFDPVPVSFAFVALVPVIIPASREPLLVLPRIVWVSPIVSAIVVVGTRSANVSGSH